MESFAGRCMVHTLASRYSHEANIQLCANLTSQGSYRIQSEERELGARRLAVCMKYALHSKLLGDLNKHRGIIDEDSLFRLHLSYI
jgi:hypothetical protein